MARARTSRRTSTREKFSQSNPVSFEQSDFEEQEENSGKQNEEEGEILEYDSPGDDNERLILPRKRFLLREKYSL